MRLAVVACLFVAGVAPALPPNYEDAPLRAITFADAREGWAVGDDGVIWHTIDAGQNWERQASGTRASLRAVQFLTPYTGFVVGRTELLNRAGSQGVLLTTSDGGVTWTTVTETLLPGLTGLLFTDDKEGVVFGETSFGFAATAFRTRDSGRSWSPEQRKAVDPALAGHMDYSGPNMFPSHDSPLYPAEGNNSRREPWANWHAGQFGAIRQYSYPDRSWQTRQCGGQRAAVLFVYKRSADVPLSMVAALAADGYLCAAITDDADAEYLLPAAMRQAGGAGAIRGKLAEMVAAWQPEVVVTDLPEYGVTAAKVYTPAAGPGEGVVSLNLTAYVPELGGSPRDVAEPAALLFGPTPQPDALHFKLVGGTMKDAAGHKSLMEGINLGEGGTARRKKPTAAPADRETVASARRELEKQLAAPPTPESVSAAIAKLKTLPEADAARAGVMLGFRLAQAGQWTAARELFACVAEHYPAYPDAVEAVRWLVRFHGSGEARRRVELGHFTLLSPTGWTEEPADRIQQASHTAELMPVVKWRFKSTEAARAWVKPAADLEPKLQAFGTAYARDPGNVLCVGSANRLLGLPARAGDKYASLLTTCAEPWAGRLGDELRLMGRSGEFPKGSAMNCRFARTKPFLDGKLDDACWKEADAVDGVRMLCDDQFLYVGVECKGTATGEKLPRDSDLTGRDRVELMLDVDRDYTTGYRLAVDSAGSVADECWGDRGWNPKLFVSTARTVDGWAVEVAIPLAELTGTKPSPATPWAVGVARRKAGEAEPAAMGLLRFVAAK